MARKIERKDLHELEFTDADRRFTCSVGPRLRSESTLWWWFSVSDGGTNRYAPFIAATEDTADSVQSRIIAYDDDHLARRAAPAVPRWRRPTGGGAAAT